MPAWSRLLGVVTSLAVSCSALDPKFVVNITVYHVNEHKFGAIPLNMNTADAIGDLIFDLMEVVIQPLKCGNGTQNHTGGGPDPCTNQEAAGADLRVNKLTLEVDSRFSGYGACNVGVNGTDPFHHPCSTDTYCCVCSAGMGHMNATPVPCNATLGQENVFNTIGRWGSGCQPSPRNPKPTAADCYTSNTLTKLSANQPGQWYSSLASSFCGTGPSSAYVNSTCTWRVVSVDKIVQRECHTKVFGEVVAATAPACFDACGMQKTNTSSPCWVDCFYKAALGPDAGKPGGAVTGMSTDTLVAAWVKPFLPVENGGCPPQ